MSRSVVVIFGAAVRADGRPSRVLADRVRLALRCGATLARPIYLPTGGVGRRGPAEASVMARLLREAGVEDADILVEDTATDTLRSARACARVLRRHGLAGAPVLAASSAYHLPRCVLLLRLAGLDARAAPPPWPAPTPNTLLRWQRRLHEVVALPYDAVQLGALAFVGGCAGKAKARGSAP